jgi:hypothetical protein
MAIKEIIELSNLFQQVYYFKNHYFRIDAKKGLIYPVSEISSWTALYMYKLYYTLGARRRWVQAITQRLLSFCLESQI